MTTGRVLYDNRLRDAGAAFTYTGTLTTGYPAANVADWRDFTSFRASTGSTTLDVARTPSGTITSVAIYFRTPVTAGTYTVQAQAETAPATFTNLGSAFNCAPGQATVQMQVLSNPVAVIATGKIRFLIVVPGSAYLDIRQLVVGQELQFEIGQHVDIAPPTLTYDVILSNPISVNGSFIGRDQVRTEKRAKIELDLLTPTWVRTSWEPFVLHAVRYPFIYEWDLDDHPAEGAFAMASELTPPTNMMPVPRMKVEMPLRCLL